MPPQEDLPICCLVSLLPYLPANILSKKLKAIRQQNGEKERKVEIK
jgi:hypothetical protein